MNLWKNFRSEKIHCKFGAVWSSLRKKMQYIFRNSSVLESGGFPKGQFCAGSTEAGMLHIQLHGINPILPTYHLLVKRGLKQDTLNWQEPLQNKTTLVATILMPRKEFGSGWMVRIIFLVKLSGEPSADWTRGEWKSSGCRHFWDASRQRGG